MKILVTADLITSCAAEVASNGVDINEAIEIVGIMHALETNPGKASFARCDDYCARSPEHHRRFEQVSRLVNAMLATVHGPQPCNA